MPIQLNVVLSPATHESLSTFGIDNAGNVYNVPLPAKPSLTPLKALTIIAEDFLNIRKRYGEQILPIQRKIKRFIHGKMEEDLQPRGIRRSLSLFLEKLFNTLSFKGFMVSNSELLHRKFKALKVEQDERMLKVFKAHPTTAEFIFELQNLKPKKIQQFLVDGTFHLEGTNYKAMKESLLSDQLSKRKKRELLIELGNWKLGISFIFQIIRESEGDRLTRLIIGLTKYGTSFEKNLLDEFFKLRQADSQAFKLLRADINNSQILKQYLLEMIAKRYLQSDRLSEFDQFLTTDATTSHLCLGLRTCLEELKKKKAAELLLLTEEELERLKREVKHVQFAKSAVSTSTTGKAYISNGEIIWK